MWRDGLHGAGDAMTTEEIVDLAEEAGAEWSDFGRIQFESEDDLARFVDLILERTKNV